MDESTKVNDFSAVIDEIKHLPVATPEILEQIAHKAYADSTLPDDALSDDNDGMPGGFAQLLSSGGLQQYISDSIDNGVYGDVHTGNAICKSAAHGLLISALVVYREASKRSKALWFLQDNDWPDSARLAKPKDVIGCLENIQHDAKYYND